MLHELGQLSISSETSNKEVALDSWVLHELVERLARAGYGEFYASFNPLAPLRSDWATNRQAIPDHLRAFVDLFLLAEPVEVSLVDKTLGELIRPLSDLGLLTFTKQGQIATPNLVLLPVFGQWLFCQKPQVSPTLYFGEDSVALLLRLRPRRGGRCLDLCAGPGVQSLYCSLFSKSVTAVEINPIAAALAQVNMVMNARENIVSVFCGDLYEPIEGTVFDTIVANPPLLPFPDDIAYPFVGHGGADGLRITWRILQGLPAALSPDGTAQLIGTCLSDGILPLWIDTLADWAHQSAMNVLLTVITHQPLAPGSRFFDGLVNTAATASKTDPRAIATAYQRSLARQGASHLCSYFLHVTVGTGKLHLQDLSQEGKQGFWYL